MLTSRRMVGSKKNGIEYDPSESRNRRRRPKSRQLNSLRVSSVTKINQQNQGMPTPFELISEDIKPNITAEASNLCSNGPESLMSTDAASPLLRDSLCKIGHNSQTCSEKPLFTLEHIKLIYQQKVKDREREIREEYEHILNKKMCEQYDTFIKFTHDQIEKQFESSAPSYLS